MVYKEVAKTCGMHVHMLTQKGDANPSSNKAEWHSMRVTYIKLDTKEEAARQTAVFWHLSTVEFRVYLTQCCSLTCSLEFPSALLFLQPDKRSGVIWIFLRKIDSSSHFWAISKNKWGPDPTFPNSVQVYDLVEQWPWLHCPC